MNAVTSFCCDLILDVHYDIITSEMTLKMTWPAVVFDATFICLVDILLMVMRSEEVFCHLGQHPFLNTTLGNVSILNSTLLWLILHSLFMISFTINFTYRD